MCPIDFLWNLETDFLKVMFWRTVNRHALYIFSVLVYDFQKWRLTRLDVQLLSLLVGALSTVNHKGLHQGWTQTSLYLQVIYFTSHYTTSHVFWAYLYSAGTRHGNLHPTGWPILSCGPTLEPVLATANTRKNRERFWKKCRWMDRKGRNKQGRNPGSKRSMYVIYWSTPGFKGRTFKLCVLTRWDFNFCVRSSPLRGSPS